MKDYTVPVRLTVKAESYEEAKVKVLRELRPFLVDHARDWHDLREWSVDSKDDGRPVRRG